MSNTITFCLLDPNWAFLTLTFCHHCEEMYRHARSVERRRIGGSILRPLHRQDRNQSVTKTENEDEDAHTHAHNEQNTKHCNAETELK